AMFARERELRFSRCRGDHASAQRLAQFHRGEADAARGAEHEQRLAGLELRSILERVLRGAIGQKQRGRFVEGHRIGNLPAVSRGTDHFLSHAALYRTHEHAIPESQALDARAERIEDAGDLAAGRERSRWLDLIEILKYKQNRTIYAASAHRAPDLAGTCHRLGNLVEFQSLGTAGPAAQQRPHAQPPPPGPAPRPGSPPP